MYDNAITFPKKNHSCHYYLEKVYRYTDNVTSKAGGFIMPRLAYIIKGSCTVFLENGETLTCNENSIWFIPKNKFYTANWRTNGYISFYVIEFDTDFISESLTTFHVLNNTDTLPLFDELFESRKNNDSIRELKSFYAILDKVLPFIKKDEYKNIDSILPALNFLKENYTKNVHVKELADLCYMSQSRFFQVFKEITNTSPIEYKNALKLDDAKNRIQKGISLEKVCEELNFSSPAFLRRLIKKYYKKTPKELRKEPLLI